MEQKQFALLEKTFRQGFQNCILYVRRTIWQIIESSRYFHNNFGFWAKDIQNFGESFSPGFSKLYFNCPEEIFGKKVLQKNFFSLFENFYSLSKTVSGILAEKSRQACRNSMPCVKRNVLRKVFSKKNF